MNTQSGDGDSVAPPEAGKLPVSAHLLCAWPLVLVAIGGAIGGGLGGAAYATNLAIYKSQLPPAAKILLNLSAGTAAVVVWFGLALAIGAARN